MEGEGWGLLWREGQGAEGGNGEDCRGEMEERIPPDSPGPEYHPPSHSGAMVGVMVRTWGWDELLVTSGCGVCAAHAGKGFL